MAVLPRFFETPDDFRAWLEANHDTHRELLVGFYKKHTGKLSITWEESVEEALCFGWIDGVRKSLGEESYTIRFSPRRPESKWSTVNISLVEKLEKEGRMREPGRTAFAQRREDRSGIYAYEQSMIEVLATEYEEHLRELPTAWEFFTSQPNWYRKQVIHTIMAAKKEETRLRRLRTYMEAFSERRRF